MRRVSLLLLSVFAASAVMAQTKVPARPGGTEVVVPATGEVRRANDEARAILTVEEQDRDRTLAVSRANQKMKQAMEILRREDPQAKLESRAYHTYPVYSEGEGHFPGRARQLVAWRVSQSLEMRTASLDKLPRTIASAQGVAALNGLYFGLSDETRRKMDQQVIEAAYRHLEQRLSAIASAMGRTRAEAVLEKIDFSSSDFPRPAMAEMALAKSASPRSVEEPGFEPGETTLQMQIVGHVRFR